MGGREKVWKAEIEDLFNFLADLIWFEFKNLRLEKKNWHEKVKINWISVEKRKKVQNNFTVKNLCSAAIYLFISILVQKHETCSRNGCHVRWSLQLPLLYFIDFHKFAFDSKVNWRKKAKTNERENTKMWIQNRGTNANNSTLPSGILNKL